MHFNFHFKAFELGEGLDVGEEGDYFLVHFEVGEPKVDYILDEGQEEEAGRYAVGFFQMFE